MNENANNGIMMVPRELSDNEVMERAMQLMYRKMEERPQFVSNADAARYFHAKLADRDREYFAIMYFDCQMKLLKYDEPFAGSLTNCVTSPRVIAKEALMLNAKNIVIAHNHPSGDPTPSQPDRDMTMRLAQALEMLEISLCDHIVVGREGDYSIAAEGLL